MTRPQIVVYALHEGDAPTAMQYAAAMVPNGKPGSYWMSTGSSPEMARATLVAMWDKAYPPEKRRAPKAKVVEVLDDLV